MIQKKFCPYCGGPLTKKWWEGTERLFCDTCIKAIYENPLPAACTVVVDNQNRILLVERSVAPQAGKWCLPGGFMELGETSEGAALRELKEETSLTGRIDTLLGVTTSRGEHHPMVLLIGYLVTNYTGDPVAGDDASDVGFFPISNLPEIAFSTHRHFIRIYCAAHAKIFKEMAIFL
ncbi:MAG: NUDIX hydrolase [Desulfobacterales bacterium]|jgi:ADP-ribose pyrophosphatase YjhB (NUDIX family)|nr:NUDIX hydrolase [Desulfobacterales bacterium]